MQMVVLDGFTLNPGDLSWDGLRKLGECTIYDRTAPEEVIERARNAEIVFTNKTPLSSKEIDAIHKLRYIGILATGSDVVDLHAALRRGVVVTNIPIYGTASVAQLTIAHLLNLAHHLADHAQSVKEGRWSASKDFCYWEYPLIELEGLTLGIIGFGRIGRATALLAAAFGMRVIAHDPSVIAPVQQNVRMVGLDEVFSRSDVVSLHCPLTSRTRNLINKRRLALMKRGAFLINTSRGPLVDETALAEALNAGRIAGAALDVLESEPPMADNPLFKAKNCYLTPHIAWATQAARKRLMNTAIENLEAFLQSKVQNQVFPQKDSPHPEDVQGVQSQC